MNRFQSLFQIKIALQFNSSLFETISMKSFNTFQRASTKFAKSLHDFDSDNDSVHWTFYWILAFGECSMEILLDHVVVRSINVENYLQLVFTVFSSGFDEEKNKIECHENGASGGKKRERALNSCFVLTQVYHTRSTFNACNAVQRVWLR